MTREIRVPLGASPRDLAAVVFRHRWAVVICYAVIVAGTAAYCFFWPPTYEARVRYLVKNTRLEPLLTADQEAVRTVSVPPVTEADLNSEAEIMQSQAVLERTAHDLDLEHAPVHWAVRLLRAPIDAATRVYNSYHGRPNEGGLGRAVGRLASALNVQPERESNVILVTLRWGHPLAAEQILTKLSQVYLAQHLAVHRAPDATQFFASQVERSKVELASIDAQMATIRPGATSAQLESDRALVAQQASEFEAEKRKATVLAAEDEARIRDVKAQLQTLPDTLVLQDRSVVAAQALEALKVRVLDLRLQHTQLLQKYAPTHPLVTEVEQRLSQAEQMLNDEERRSYSERTTGRNQTADALDQDLRLTQAQLTGLAARQEQTGSQEAAFRAREAELIKAASQLRNLERDRAAVQRSIDEYRRRYEEARVSDEMQFVNVGVIEPVSSGALPVKPSIGLLMKLALGLGVIVAVALAFGLDYLDHRVRTDRELEAASGVPVLAVFDDYRDALDGGRRRA